MESRESPEGFANAHGGGEVFADSGGYGLVAWVWCPGAHRVLFVE